MFDHYLTHEGPAALVIREHLMPIEGKNGVLFPSTYAAGDGFPGGYNIDTFEDNNSIRSACLIDSVGSQANRIEPLFLKKGYCELLPKIVIKAGEKEINILEVSHRAGDALVRCSELQEKIQKAFKSLLLGDAVPLAKIAPTSLVFGVWDSRDTQVKLPRLVSSTIRAFNVSKLTRGAVYTPPIDYAELDVFSEEEKMKAEGNNKSPLAQRGFVHNPASGTHGGIIAEGGILRDATLGLAALRHLHAGKDDDTTMNLQRYILGLALVAFTSQIDSYLRQGCILVKDPDEQHEFVEVLCSGIRNPCKIEHKDALDFALQAAANFGIGESGIYNFEKTRAKNDIKVEVDKKSKNKRNKNEKANEEMENE
jgi:CRISPR-associated protein Csb1